jgi:hypothetical protein
MKIKKTFICIAQKVTGAYLRNPRRSKEGEDVELTPKKREVSGSIKTDPDP